MTTPMRGLGGAAVLALACLAGTACAQERHGTTVTTHTTVTDDDHGHRMEIRAVGDVRTDDGDTAVVALDPSGSLRIEERRDGRTRRAEWTRGADGSVRRAYTVDGRARAWEGEGAAWARAMLRRAVRHDGMGARARVERLRAGGGVDAVLEAAEALESDGARRQYYRTLLSGGAPLRPGEAERVTAHAARTIRSDGELRMVLDEARRLPLSPRGRVALLDAAATLRSDGEKALLLRHLATPQSLGDATERAAFFRAAGTLRSDGERAVLLRHVLRGVPTRPVAAAALRSARDIRSDGEKGAVLRAVPAALLTDAAVRGAYDDALATFGSDGEREAARRHLERSVR